MKKILLLLANGFETLEASVFIDVIGWNQVDGDKSTQLFTCGLTPTVNTTFNQKMLVDFTLDDICLSDFDALAIPGGFEEYAFYEDGYSEAFGDVIRAFDQQGKTIASICVAALLLGKSDVLKGRTGTTYNMNGGIRQKQLAEFDVQVLNQPIVIDRNIITSWNPSTAMDVAFALLEDLTGPENTHHIKSIMGY